LFLEVVGLDVVPDVFLFAFLLLHFSEEHSTGLMDSREAFQVTNKMTPSS